MKPAEKLAAIAALGATALSASAPGGAADNVQDIIDTQSSAYVYPDRASAVAAWATRRPNVKSIAWLDTLAPSDARYTIRVVEKVGATHISDMPGAVPDGIVRPEHFGAAGDGVTDDIGPLQRAEIYCRRTFSRLEGLGSYAVASNFIALAPYISLNLVRHPSFTGTQIVDINWQRVAAAAGALPINPWLSGTALSTQREDMNGYHRIHIDGLHEPSGTNTLYQEVGFRLFGVRSPLFRALYTGTRLYVGAVCTNDTEKQSLDFGFWRCRTALRIQRETVAPIGTDNTPSESFYNLAAGECGCFLDTIGLGSARVALEVENTYRDILLPGVSRQGGFNLTLAGIIRGCNSEVAAVYSFNGGDTNPGYLHFDDLLIQVNRYSPALVVNDVMGLSGNLRVSESHSGVAVIKKVTGSINLNIDALRSQILTDWPLSTTQPLVVVGDDVTGDIRSGFLRIALNDMRTTSPVPLRKALVVKNCDVANTTNMNNATTAPLRGFRVDLIGDGTTAGVDILDSRVMTSGEIVASRAINWLNQTTFRSLDLSNSGMKGWTGAIADDTAISFTPIKWQGLLTISFAGNTSRYAQIFFNGGATPATTLLHSAGNMAVTTGVLAGTTGADTFLTVSMDNTGKMYIENRLGSATSVKFEIF